jgi:hypothetical protein
MICIEALEKYVYGKITFYEREHFQLAQNMDDLGLILLAKKIRVDCCKINKLFLKVGPKCAHLEKVQLFYQLFVTIQLSRIRKKLKELGPILKVLCTVVK